MLTANFKNTPSSRLFTAPYYSIRLWRSKCKSNPSFLCEYHQLSFFIENVVCYTANLKLTFKCILRLRKYGKLLIVNWALLLMYLTFSLKQRLVVWKSWPEIYEQFTVIYHYMGMQQTSGVSWCFRRAQSPNDVLEKFKKTLKNTHTTKQDNTEHQDHNTKKHPKHYFIHLHIKEE